MNDSQKEICGNCMSCSVSVRNDGTGFCFNVELPSTIRVPLNQPGCAYWKSKIQNGSEDAI